jgi:hypothetical protein
MEDQIACKDPFYDLIPEKMWLRVTNVGVRHEGMVKIILEVNGQEKVLFDSYVIDGTVIHDFNLTGWLNKSEKTS